MIKIQEMEVKNPRTYIAHGSKLRLAKRMGQKDTDPLFKLLCLPKSKMDQLSQELEEFELPGKSNQDVIDEFCEEIHKSHTGDDSQDDSTSLSCSVSSKTKTSEDGMSDNRSSDEFLSFHQSPGSGGSEASTPEQEFTRHFDLDDLEPEVLNQTLQDSSVEEEEPVSAASQLIPDPEPVFEEPQSEELVPDQDLVRATIPEPEPEKYIRLHITEEEEQTIIPQESGSESSSRRKSNRILKPVEKFDSAQFKIPSITSRVPSIRGRAKSTLKDMKSILQESWKERPTASLNPRARSTSRESSASTKTRAASLEKLRTGSIKSSKSKVSTRYQVENQVEKGEEGEESSWSDTEDETEKEKESGGLNVLQF